MTPRILVRWTILVALASCGCGHAAPASRTSSTSAAREERPGESHVVVIDALEPQRDGWLEQLRQVTPEQRWPAVAADGILNLAEAHELVGDFDDAESLYRAYEQAAETAQLPAIIRTTGTLLRAFGAFDRGAYADAIGLFRAICETEPEEEPHAEQIATACAMIPHVGAVAGDASILARIPALSDDAPGFVERTRERAFVLAMLGRVDEAEAELRRVVPAFDLGSLEESLDHRTFALIQYARGRFDTALEAHRRELALDERTARASGATLPPSVEADDVAYLVRAGLSARRPEQVCGHARTTLARVRSEYGDRHPTTGRIRVRVAQCALLTGNRDGAADEARRALEAFASSAPTHVGRIEAEALGRELGIR